jgi:hypothetical protein
MFPRLGCERVQSISHLSGEVGEAGYLPALFALLAGQSIDPSEAAGSSER